MSKNLSAAKSYMSVKEAQDFLGVSVHRVRKLLWERRLDTVKEDNRTMISVASLTEYKTTRDARKAQAPTYGAVTANIDSPGNAPKQRKTRKPRQPKVPVATPDLEDKGFVQGAVVVTTEPSDASGFVELLPEPAA
jgi:hypothetical protein